VRATVGQKEGMPMLPPAFLRSPFVKEPKGLQRAWRRDEKGGTEEVRVTEEFRNDRRPVASLTDDALLRSRLQAQKDGTAVMDSKWLEIVGCCHRATPLFLSLSLYLYLLWLSSFIPLSKLTARDVLFQRPRMELHKILVYFLRANFRLHETVIVKKQITRHTEYFIKYIHHAVQYKFGLKLSYIPSN